MAKSIEELLIEANVFKIFMYDSIDKYYDPLGLNRGQQMVVKYIPRHGSPQKDCVHFRSESLETSLTQCIEWLHKEQEAEWKQKH